jgi:hypothetical protein
LSNARETREKTQKMGEGLSWWCAIFIGVDWRVSRAIDYLLPAKDAKGREKMEEG